MGCSSSQKPKKKHRKGLWSPDEDERLRDYILKHGHGSWSSVPINTGLQRNGKSCRLRWINYLRPGLKRGALTIAEEETIFTLHNILGNKWSQIANHLPGRTDNEVKNYWHSYLKKRVVATMGETINNNDCINGQIQGVESSNYCMSSIPLFKSVDVMKGPSQNEADRNISLPKVLFAEWLSLDQDLGDVFDFKSVEKADDTSNNVGDTFIDGLVENDVNEIYMNMKGYLPCCNNF